MKQFDLFHHNWLCFLLLPWFPWRCIAFVYCQLEGHVICQPGFQAHKLIKARVSGFNCFQNGFVACVPCVPLLVLKFSLPGSHLFNSVMGLDDSWIYWVDMVLNNWGFGFCIVKKTGMANILVLLMLFSFYTLPIVSGKFLIFALGIQKKKASGNILTQSAHNSIF